MRDCEGRKGFTLAEVMICTIVLAVTVIGCVLIGRQISVLKVESRNDVFLSMHNLNVAEELRQWTYELKDGEDLRSYYGPQTDNVSGGEATDVEAVRNPFSNSEVTTEVYVTKATLGDFRVYTVKIDSRMVGYYQGLVSNYTLTDIGGVKPITDETPDWEWDPSASEYVPSPSENVLD